MFGEGGSAAKMDYSPKDCRLIRVVHPALCHFRVAAVMTSLRCADGHEAAAQRVL